MPSATEFAQLLDDAITLVPYLSDDDHGEVLRLCSVYLLAYLLPYSTGMDYYLAQNLALKEHELDTFSIDDYIIHMSLEERINNAAKYCPSIGRCGDDEFTLTDQDTEIAFGDLLDQFVSFLDQRPVHTHQVDLIHLFAMMIHPCHAQNFISKTIYPIKSVRSSAWAKAVRLMECSTSSNFQIHYGHRRQVVQIISQCLIIREGVNDYVPLYTGALPHLLASLHQFYSHTGEGLADSNDALRGIVALVVQSRHRSSKDQDDCCIIQSKYDWLIDLMMEERVDCPCAGPCRTDRSAPERHNNGAFCSYQARGEVLSDLIALTFRSKQLVNTKFLLYVTNSLAELIEWQVDYWNMKIDESCTSDTDNVDSESRTYSPCLLAALLSAARQVFYFLATENRIKQTTDSMDDDDPYGVLIRCSIAMLRHPERCIVTAATKLVLQAFVMFQGKQMNEFNSILSQSITETITLKKGFSRLMQPMVAIASSRSFRAATFLFNLISPHWQKTLEDQREDAEKSSANVFSSEEASAWLLMITMNCPLILSKSGHLLFSSVANNVLPASNSSLVAKSLLNSRFTHFFMNDHDINASCVVEKLMTSNSYDPWTKYKMGRNALVSGHFGLAQKIFRMLLNECESMDSSHYIWISFLESISGAEAIFATVADRTSCKGSSMGIPDASTKLYSSVSYIETLQTTCAIWRDSGLFQLRFVLLRLDFIDLATVLRHLTRERRLTGKPPSKGTRSYWHLQNVAKSFDALAFRYHELYRQFGMCFKHNQSTTSLALLQSLSSFMAVVARVSNSDVFAPNKTTEMKTSYFKVNDNITHPMASLMRRLYELVVEPMIGVTAIDNRIRAAATLELIDGIFLAPLPVPRDFFIPVPSCVPDILISADPNPVFDEYDEALSIIESAPTIAFSFYVSGKIDIDYLKVSMVPVWSIVLWFQLKFASQLLLDEYDNSDITGTDANMNEDTSTLIDSGMDDVPIPDLSIISPVVSKIHSSGHFFFEVNCPPLNMEGNYRLCTKLGCRDANGNDWEIPGCFRTALVQISRARSIVDIKHEKTTVVTY